MNAPTGAPIEPVAAAVAEPAPAVVAVPAPAGVPEAAPVRARRVSPLVVWVSILGVIGIVASLYLARAFFVPLLIGIFTSYALRPLVDWLKERRIPRALGAALVMATLLAGASWATFSLSEDASAMIAKLPEAARKVRERMRLASEDGPSSLQKIQEAATELQGAATDATAATAATAERKPARRQPTAITIRDAEPVWMRDYVVAQSALLFTVAAQAPIVLLLAYFLLASGEHFRRKLVQHVGPSLSRKKDAVRILEEVDTQIQRYLVVTVASNVLVGLGTWLAFEAMGMEQAGVWGVAAGVLHFVPYLGPVVFAIATGFAAYLQFGTAIAALSLAGVSLLVAAAVGSVFVTWVQSHFARVNAAVLFIALLFFGWLWGIWGLLLGAPLVAIAKVICDRVDALKPAGDLLGH